MPTWGQLFEYFSFSLYSLVEYSIWTSKSKTFHSPFYTIFLAIGLLDLISFPFYQIRPFFNSWPSARTINGFFTKIFRDGHYYLDVVMSANRLTIVLLPTAHSRIWQTQNLRRAIAFCIFLMFFAQSYTIVFIFLYGWKNEKMGYPQVIHFDAWNRFYYALQLIIATISCFVMNVITLWKMKNINRQGQWSLLGISLFSTLLAIPPTIYQSLMAYTAFADNPALESAVFNSMSSWVFSFAGYYQPYWLLAVSSESRREIFRYFRRFLTKHVTPNTATQSKFLQKSSSNQKQSSRVVVDSQSPMKVG